MNWQFNTIPVATNIQLIIFNFQICLPWLFTTKMVIVHIHVQYMYNVCLELIVAFWLVSSYNMCLNHHIYSLDTASSSLLVAWYLNSFSAAGSTSGFRNWWLFTTIDPYAVVSNQFRLQLLVVKLLL